MKNYTSANQYGRWIADSDFTKVNGELCKHGGVEGGPGYLGFGRCKLIQSHPNVRYGCEHCPDDCRDYKCIEGEQLYNFFLSYVLDKTEEKAEHARREELAFYKVTEMFDRISELSADESNHDCKQ